MASDQNTPSPEQTQKEGPYKVEHIEGSGRWTIVGPGISDMWGVYENAVQAECDNLNRAFQAGAAHVQAQAAPVQPSYVYSTDYDKLFELVVGGGEAFAKRDHPFLAGFRHPIGIEHVRGNIETRNEAYKNECFGPDDKEKFVRWCSNKNLQWISANGEKERSGPSVEEVIDILPSNLAVSDYQRVRDLFNTYIDKR